MKIDSISKMLETDITALLKQYHESKNSESAGKYADMYKNAYLMGYQVEILWDESDPIVVVREAESGGDINRIVRWASMRESYRYARAVEHNDANAEAIEKWEPNNLDSAVMKELGITWATPEPEREHPPQEQAVCIPRPQSHSDRPEELRLTEALPAPVDPLVQDRRRFH